MNDERLSDIRIADGKVYKRMFDESSDLIGDKPGWKKSVPEDLIDDLVRQAYARPPPSAAYCGVRHRQNDRKIPSILL